MHPMCTNVVVLELIYVLAIAQGVSLALSLHAPTSALRQQIVPSARAYPLDKLMAVRRKSKVPTHLG